MTDDSEVMLGLEITVKGLRVLSDLIGIQTLEGVPEESGTQIEYPEVGPGEDDTEIYDPEDSVDS
jgi:hypothetical protein